MIVSAAADGSELRYRIIDLWPA